MDRNQISLSELDELHTDIGWFVGKASLVGEALRGGDIAVDRTGDFVLRTGVNEIAEALKRRLSTPRAFYECWALDVDGLKSLDSEYGNPAFSGLSEPMTSSWLRSLVSAVTLTVNQEERVRLRSVNLDQLSLERGYVALTIEYEVIGLNIVYTVQLEMTGEELLLTPD